MEEYFNEKNLLFCTVLTQRCMKYSFVMTKYLSSRFHPHICVLAIVRQANEERKATR